MKHILREKKKLAPLVGIAICAILILFSGHALQTILSFKDYILFGACGIAFLLLLTSKSFWKINLPKAVFLYFLVMIALTAVASMGAGYWYYLLFISMIVIAFAVSEFVPFETMVRVYVNVMTVVSAVALVGYVLLQNTTLLYDLPIYTNHNGVEYGVGVIFNYVVHEPDRNCGMFWEPGLFATHLTIAMVMELLCKPKANLLRMVLFSVCIFTANSSAGFVLWFLCMLLWLVKNQNRKLGLISGIICTLLLILAIVFVLNFDLILSNTSLGENEYFQKLMSDSVFESSRVKAVVHNWNVFITDPLFGVGYTSASTQMVDVANTSTSTFLLSVFGIPAIACTVFWIYAVMKLPRVNTFAKIVLLAIVLSVFNKEPHDQILFTWCILFYLLQRISQNVNDKRIIKQQGGAVL